MQSLRSLPSVIWWGSILGALLVGGGFLSLIPVQQQWSHQVTCIIKSEFYCAHELEWYLDMLLNMMHWWCDFLLYLIHIQFTEFCKGFSSHVELVQKHNHQGNCKCGHCTKSSEGGGTDEKGGGAQALRRPALVGKEERGLFLAVKGWIMFSFVNWHPPSQWCALVVSWLWKTFLSAFDWCGISCDLQKQVSLQDLNGQWQLCFTTGTKKVLASKSHLNLDSLRSPYLRFQFMYILTHEFAWHFHRRSQLLQRVQMWWKWPL